VSLHGVAGRTSRRARFASTAGRDSVYMDEAI
jgi:hypothetical protein